MLILQRKAGQSLVIGDNIVVSVVSIEEGRVRLAIDAPRDIPILRTELRTAMEANRAAAHEDASPLALLELLKSDSAPTDPVSP